MSLNCQVYSLLKEMVWLRVLLFVLKYIHSSTGLPKYITLSYGDSGKSAIEAILWCLGSRSEQQDPFFKNKIRFTFNAFML